MLVTTQFPSGNGRILRADAQSIEVELIAYSKGARYTHIKISDIQAPRSQTILLRADAWFRVPHFAYKLHAEVWVRTGRNKQWTTVGEVSKTPASLEFTLDLQPGETYWISTEPPIDYVETTAEFFRLAATHPDIAEVHYQGHSHQHRGIFLLRVTAPENRAKPGDEKRPVIHIVAGEHATEFAGEAIARGMLAHVLSPEGAAIRSRYIFDIVLNANPDGNFHGWHQYNLRDWKEHNYADTVDRSWHHELRTYLTGQNSDPSPEAVAAIDWLVKTRPALYISMHSWEGHEGNPGAYYTSPSNLTPEMGRGIQQINTFACANAARLGFQFHACESVDDKLHLGHYLMQQGACFAYLPEGNYFVGFERLSQFGKHLLSDVLEDSILSLETYDRTRWDVVASPFVQNKNSSDV